MESIISRAQYEAAPKRLHEPYYLAIAREAHIVLSDETIERVRRGDSIPVTTWEIEAQLHLDLLAEALAKRGDRLDVVSLVCTMKVYARSVLSIE
jgi:hypothetical protein